MEQGWSNAEVTMPPKKMLVIIGVGIFLIYMLVILTSILEMLAQGDHTVTLASEYEAVEGGNAYQPFWGNEWHMRGHINMSPTSPHISPSIIVASDTAYEKLSVELLNLRIVPLVDPGPWAFTRAIEIVSDLERVKLPVIPAFWEQANRTTALNMQLHDFRIVFSSESFQFLVHMRNVDTPTIVHFPGPGRYKAAIHHLASRESVDAEFDCQDSLVVPFLVIEVSPEDHRPAYPFHEGLWQATSRGQSWRYGVPSALNEAVTNTRRGEHIEGKYLLFVGDSTVQENAAIMARYLNCPPPLQTQCGCEFGGFRMFDTGMTCQTGPDRPMSRVAFSWIGGHGLCENGHGVDSLAALGAARDRIRQLTDNYSTHPNVIVYNSGAHDFDHDLVSYEQGILQNLDYLRKEVAGRNTQIIIKLTNYKNGAHCSMGANDRTGGNQFVKIRNAILERIAVQEGLGVVDSARIAESSPELNRGVFPNYHCSYHHERSAMENAACDAHMQPFSFNLACTGMLDFIVATILP